MLGHARREGAGDEVGNGQLGQRRKRHENGGDSQQRPVGGNEAPQPAEGGAERSRGGQRIVLGACGVLRRWRGGGGAVELGDEKRRRAVVSGKAGLEH